MAKLAAENVNQKAVASKKPSVKEVVSTFCGYTTAHGLGRLADGGGIFRRIAWSLFLYRRPNHVCGTDLQLVCNLLTPTCVNGS